jgi:hypothetical protein
MLTGRNKDYGHEVEITAIERHSTRSVNVYFVFQDYTVQPSTVTAGIVIVRNASPCFGVQRG